MTTTVAVQSIKSILICSIRLIGDVILTTPLIDLLAKAYPGAAIDIMVASGTGGFLKRDPRIRTVLTVPSKQVHDLRSDKMQYTALAQFFRSYDIAITMNASDRGILTAICAAKKAKIGFYENNGWLKSGWKKLFLNMPLYYDTSEHVIIHVKQVAEALGIEVNKLEVKVYWNDKDKTKVLNTLDIPAGQSGYFVIHPFARWEYKYWDMDSFVLLSDLIAGKSGLTPVWTSSPAPDECEWLRKYSEKCKITPKTIPGIFSLNQMACLIEGASLYIGLDTAITHIAASTGVPVVALYGPTEPHRWFPWNNSGPLDQQRKCQRGFHRNGNILLIQKECQHLHCIRPACKNPCMLKISVEEVFEAAGTLLDNSWANHQNKKSGDSASNA